MSANEKKTVWAACFSPTGTTRKIVNALADQIAKTLDRERKTFDFTLPGTRTDSPSFSPNDLVVLGVPVYAGRVPNLMGSYLRSLAGGGALAVPIVLYGNRAYEDSLIELRDILEEDGFCTIAGGAFIGEHSFSYILGAERPDSADMEIAAKFGAEICGKLRKGTQEHPVSVPGCAPYRNYHQPTDQQGNRLVFLKDKPKTNEECNHCGLCVKLCPLGSIDKDDPSLVSGPCMKCGACVKGCPKKAKYYDSVPFLRHKQDLEELYTNPRKEPEYFL